VAQQERASLACKKKLGVERDREGEREGERGA